MGSVLLVRVGLQGYEERKYPSVMYACTEMTYDMPDDEEGEEWSLEKVMRWMTNKKSWKERPQSKMFMRLFRYIAGVNKESQEIEMTVPVWSKMVVSEEVGTFQGRPLTLSPYF